MKKRPVLAHLKNKYIDLKSSDLSVHKTVVVVRHGGGGGGSVVVLRLLLRSLSVVIVSCIKKLF